MLWFIVQFALAFNVLEVQTDPETEGTPEDSKNQPTYQDIDQDNEREKAENNLFEDPTWSPEKLTMSMSKSKMKMTVKKYTTTRGTS